MKRLPKRTAGQRRTREISSSRNGAFVAQSSVVGGRSRQVSTELSNEGFMLNDLSPHMHRDVLNMLDDRSAAFLGSIDMGHELPGWMSLIPLTDSQMIKPPQSGQPMDIIRDRHQTLEFALFIASKLLGGKNQCTGMLFEETINEDLRKTPSIELLYWMLNGGYKIHLLSPDTALTYLPNTLRYRNQQVWVLRPGLFQTCQQRNPQAYGAFHSVGHCYTTRGLAVYCLCQFGGLQVPQYSSCHRERWYLGSESA